MPIYFTSFFSLNPLKTKLNPICHFLALLGAHHILHVSRVRVNAPLHFTPVLTLCSLIFGIHPAAVLLALKSLFSYGSTAFDLHPSYLRPIFQERN